MAVDIDAEKWQPQNGKNRSAAAISVDWDTFVITTSVSAGSDASFFSRFCMGSRCFGTGTLPGG